MNSQVQLDQEAHEFARNDRIRLFNERNQYKQKADDLELELAQSHERSQKVITVLLAVAVILIGALTYVLSSN
jgi:hypothetical protein